MSKNPEFLRILTDLLEEEKTSENQEKKPLQGKKSRILKICYLQEKSQSESVETQPENLKK